MDFRPSEQQQMIGEAVRAFADGVVRPAVARWDDAGAVPASAWAELARLGVLGMAAPDAFGGLELDAPAIVSALEELAAADAGMAQMVVQHHTLALGHVLLAGSDAQKQRLAAQLTSGKRLAAWAHGEDLANLDAETVTTRATPQGDGWILDGSKPAVWLGHLADMAIVTAQTDAGLTAFVVDLTAPGVTRAVQTGLLGLRSAGMADLRFDAAAAEMLGTPGAAAGDVGKVLTDARLATAAVALGVARSALRQAARYVQEREQFGKPIGQFQPVQWQIANSAVDLETARLLVQRAAWLAATGRPAARAIGMAKASACDAALRVADRAIQLHGGYGYTKDFSVERAYRDAVTLQVLHGTGALQRVQVAKAL